MRNLYRRRSFILCIALLASVLLLNMMVPQQAFAADKTHYIAIASDRHENEDAISNAMSGMPSSVEYVCLNGDMASFARRPRPSSDDTEGGGNGGSGTGGTAGDSGTPIQRPRPGQNPYNTSAVLAEVRSVFPTLDASRVSIIYADHDANATDDAGIMKNADTSLLPAEEGRSTPEISRGRSGLIYTGEDDSYYIYGISFQDMTDADDAEAAAAKFREWADSVDPAIPLIVVTHVPLHKFRGDNHGGSAWNKALNYAATGSEDGSETVRDVALFFGHNHSRREAELYLEPGDSLTAEGDSEESTIYYSYITAGYLNQNGTAALVAVSDDAISFTKYTAAADGGSKSVPSLMGSRSRVKYYTVVYESTGGSTVDPQRLLSGRKAGKPDDPARNDFSFTGWYTDSDCTELYDFGSEVKEDITLYAGWKRIKEPVSDDKEQDDDEAAGGEDAGDGKMPDGTASGGAAQEDTSSGGTASDGAAHDDTTSGGTVTGDTISDGAMSEGTASGGTASAGTVPVDTASGRTVTDAVSDDAVSGATPGSGTAKDEKASVGTSSGVREGSGHKADSPGTGDDERLMLWQIVMLASCAELLLLVLRRLKIDRRQH